MLLAALLLGCPAPFDDDPIARGPSANEAAHPGDGFGGIPGAPRDGTTPQPQGDAQPQPPPDPVDPKTIAADAARLERGRYLGEHVAVCGACHSPRDWSRPGGPIAPDALGAGATDVGWLSGGPPGVAVPAANLTPVGFGAWTDAELAVAITAGVARDGRLLFPAMPFSAYGELGADDVSALLAWLRALPPRGEVVPPWRKDAYLTADLRRFPRQARLRDAAPDAGDVATGTYLVSIAGCDWCHTPDNARPQPGDPAALSGGRPFVMPGGTTVRSTDLRAPAVVAMGRESFVARFRSGMATAATPMPWFAYAGIPERDLGAIYDALATPPAPLPPR
jgi:mono/diheme cytochrome c family protein